MKQRGFPKQNETNHCNRTIGHELRVRAERDTAGHESGSNQDGDSQEGQTQEIG